MNAEHAPIFYDAFNLLCGKLIGEGIHRSVYECRLRPDLIVKVEYNTDFRQFANVHECAFWDEWQNKPDVAKWLAPCEYLSPDGRLLLQRRCEPVPRDYWLPAKLPAFLSDLKRANFGILNGKLVCVDYALNVTSASSRMIKAEWND